MQESRLSVPDAFLVVIGELRAATGDITPACGRKRRIERILVTVATVERLDRLPEPGDYEIGHLRSSPCRSDDQIHLLMTPISLLRPMGV